MKALIAFGLVMFGTGPLLAQDTQPTAATTTTTPESHRGERHHWLAEKLSLSSNQQDQIKQIMSDNRARTRELRVSLLTAKKALTEALARNPLDEATIRNLSANVGSAETEMAVQRGKIRSQISGILTADQKTLWSQLSERHASRIQDHINHLNQTN